MPKQALNVVTQQPGQHFQKVRKANNLSKAIGIHLTLTRVLNTPAKCYAFAITDNGDQVFIPPALVRREQMTAADEGAGLTCPTRVNPKSIADTGAASQFIAELPISWDDQQPEEVLIQQAVEENDTVVPEAEFMALVTAADKALDMIGPLNQMIDNSEKLVAIMQAQQTKAIQVRDSLLKFQKKLDEIAPDNES